MLAPSTTRGVGRSTLHVELLGMPPMAKLEPLWRTLEAQSECSFFTSWAWIGCWLHGLDGRRHTRLLRATRGGEVVGLAVLVEHAVRRLGVWPRRELHLHATGDPVADELTIEHNGALVHHRDRERIAAAMLAYLLQHERSWDAIVLPGMSAPTALTGLLNGRHALREQVHPTYSVDLEALRRNGGDYLGALSANTRSQVRRGMRAFGELGQLELVQADDLDTALHYFGRLRALHQQRWVARGGNGAFANTAFTAFHERLLRTEFRYGSVQLLRASAGGHDIGYLYNFVHRRRVLFYQSGFDYELVPHKGKPGIVTHALAVQHNLERGHEVYDFLAGRAQYKQSLSTDEAPMRWIRLHRRSMFFALEELLRGLKRRIPPRRTIDAPIDGGAKD